MERELRPPSFGFFPPASLSDSSLRPQRAEKAPVFTTHALCLKVEPSPVFKAVGRVVIVRCNLRRDFGEPSQILWVSCAVYFSSAKKALHGVTPLRCFGLRRALLPDSASGAPAARTGSASARWWCASFLLGLSGVEICAHLCDDALPFFLGHLEPVAVWLHVIGRTAWQTVAIVQHRPRLAAQRADWHSFRLTSSVVVGHNAPCCSFSAIFARSHSAYSAFV